MSSTAPPLPLMPKPRYKILLVSRAPFVGGAEIALERLAQGFIDAGHEVLLVLGERGAVAERIERLGIRWVHLPLPLTDKRRWWSYWRARRAFRGLLVRERPDVVHSNDLPTHQFVSGTARGLPPPRICHHRFLYDGRTVNWLNKYGAEHHVFVSRAVQEELCAEAVSLQAAPGTVVYDGLPLLALPSSTERAALRERLRLPANERLVVFAGQIIPRKGVRDLLAAWPLLHETARAATRLVILGDDLQGRGIYRREMEQLAQRLNCPADFRGFQENPRDFLLTADVAVVPSHQEPLGNATLEAMACGLPVVGCAVGGIPEMIQDEETGLLVPPGAPAELASALGRLLEQPELRLRLARQGRKRCEQTFSLEAHVRAMLDVYEAELRRRARPTGATLVVSENFPPKIGGSGRWLWELYRRLPRQEYLIAAGDDPRAADFDRTHDMRVFRIPLSMRTRGLVSPHGFAAYVRGIRRLWRIERREHVRSLHCGRCLPEGWMALAVRWLAGVPYLLFVHGEEMNTASTSRELSWMARRVLGSAQLIIANSQNTAAILRKEWQVPDVRLKVLHPGVDTRRFVPAARDEVARRRLGWGARPVMLTVGRLQKRKGHDQLILALSTVRERLPEVLYAIVGDGEERPYLEKLADQQGLKGHVQFLGEVGDDELVTCYQQCDLFVLPNRQVGRDIEGFGMVLLEAQACGRPVVAGASGGTAETMRVGESGEVVSCESAPELAAVLIRLLGDPPLLERMGRAGRAWAEQHFDWHQLARQAEEIFHSAAGAADPATIPLNPDTQ